MFFITKDLIIMIIIILYSIDIFIYYVLIVGIVVTH